MNYMWLFQSWMVTWNFSCFLTSKVLSLTVLFIYWICCTESCFGIGGGETPKTPQSLPRSFLWTWCQDVEAHLGDDWYVLLLWNGNRRKLRQHMWMCHNLDSQLAVRDCQPALSVRMFQSRANGWIGFTSTCIDSYGLIWLCACVWGSVWVSWVSVSVYLSCERYLWNSPMQFLCACVYYLYITGCMEFEDA